MTTEEEKLKEIEKIKDIDGAIRFLAGELRMTVLDSSCPLSLNDVVLESYQYTLEECGISLNVDIPLAGRMFYILLAAMLQALYGSS